MTEEAGSYSGQRVVLAIDPGRSKCGVAVVDERQEVVHREVVPTVSLEVSLQELCRQYRPSAVLIGNGTGSVALQGVLNDLSLGCPVSVVEECYTSEAARKRYVAEIPATGWRRLLPSSLRTPERAYDDFVAVILAERWWRSQRESAE